MQIRDRKAFEKQDEMGRRFIFLIDVDKVFELCIMDWFGAIK